MNFVMPERFGTLSRDDIAELTGLEQLQRIVDGRFPAPPIARVFHYTLHSVALGEAVFVGEPAEDFLNPLGTVHGGWAATLLDSSLACAVHSTLAVGEFYTTLEFKVNCVRAILPDTGLLTCAGRIIHRGRTTATSEATLKGADGKLYAHGTETCMIMPAKQDGAGEPSGSRRAG